MTELKKITLRFALLVVCAALATLVYNCAKVGTITGGKKDVTPPYLVSSEPVMFATNMKEKKVKLVFNEFVQLKDIGQQMNVSPPFKKRPKIWVNNKSVFIQFSDTLFDSTTYTFNFGKAIVDNNEGNVLENFEYVFSTSNYIDSMGVKGRIVDALTQKSNKDALLAVLYANLNDSAPIKEKPMFTSRTDKNGYFSINNVKPGKYRLYAFKDNNFNLKYDVAQEMFAFSDTIVVLEPNAIAHFLEAQKTDTTAFKPKKLKADTALTDSAKLAQQPDSVELKRRRNSLIVDLFSFTEKNKQQFVQTYAWRDKHFLLLTFTNRLKNDSLLITPIYYKNEDWHKKEYLGNHDSTLIWITDTSLLRYDTIRTAVSYWGTNKKGDTIWTSDTLNFRYVAEAVKDEPKKKKKIVHKSNGMKIKCSVESTLDPNFPPVIEAEYLVGFPDTSHILFTKKVDTLKIRQKYEIVADTIGFRKFKLKHKWELESDYQLTFFPGAFTNIYGIPNDTVKFTFKTLREDAYGKLTINLENVKEQVIIQLIDNERVMYEKITSQSGQLVFDNIKPGKYTIRAIYDSNGDKKWTTGFYMKKKQAEKVIYFDETKSIRANWDMDMVWDLE